MAEVTDPALLAKLNGQGGAETPPPKSESKEPAEDTRSIPERVGTGFMDPIYGGAQIGARMQEETPGFVEAPGTREARIAAVDKTVRDREEEIQRKRGGDTSTDWWRVGGSILNPMNYAPAAAGGLPGAIGVGFMTGLTQPVTKGDYATEKLKDTMWGTAFGGLGGKVTELAGRAIAPTLGAAAKYLMERGVELTPGQMAGGILKRAEEAFKSAPILGGFIRNAEARSIETFDRAAINHALAPIGEDLPDATKMGREAIDYAHLRLSDAYDNLLPKMHFTMDNQFASDISNLRLLASELPNAQAQQFENILNNRVAQRLKPSGTMDGQTLKQVESELGALARSYYSSADAAQRQLASAINELRFSIREGLVRQNPQQAEALQKINAAYALFTRVESASGRRASSNGIFTPADLLAAVKAGDKSVRKGQFARGDALMQDFAEFGGLVLPNKLPDSGTTERLLWEALALGAGHAAAPAIVRPEVLAGIGVATLPYTKAGGKVARAYAQPGPTRESIGQMVQKASPFAADPAASVAQQVGTE